MSPIEKAFAFVNTSVLEPALSNAELPKSIKQRVANSQRWLERFTRVGDLLTYLQRFRVGGHQDDTYRALKSCGLATFEDIVDEFETRFAIWAKDHSTPQSFIVGRQYSTFDILIFVGAYDTRAGGMFLLGRPEHPQAVVIKATLSGGRYPNAWLEPHRRLKYYLKKIGNVFGEHYQENAAILNTPGLPVLTFVRDLDTDPFTYEGAFGFAAKHDDPDGAKWFELVSQPPATAAQSIVDQDAELSRTAEEAALARELSDDELQRRLQGEPRKPAKIMTQATAFARSALVVEAVLRRAKGECEGCRDPAPFSRRSNGTPYLEVHHRIRLADDGDDTVENSVALCPNCHREAHYG